MFTDVYSCHVSQVNEKLASKLHGYKEAVTGRNMVDRVVYLEMELSEALDANDMYKLQLRRYSEPLFEPTPLLAVVLVEVCTVVSIKSRKSAIGMERRLRAKQAAHLCLCVVGFGRTNGLMTDYLVSLYTLVKCHGLETHPKAVAWKLKLTFVTSLSTQVVFHYRPVCGGPSTQ